MPWLTAHASLHLLLVKQCCSSRSWALCQSRCLRWLWCPRPASTTCRLTRRSQPRELTQASLRMEAPWLATGRWMICQQLLAPARVTRHKSRQPRPSLVRQQRQRHNQNLQTKIRDMPRRQYPNSSHMNAWLLSPSPTRTIWVSRRCWPCHPVRRRKHEAPCGSRGTAHAGTGLKLCP
jgi:hypothetical protein